MPLGRRVSTRDAWITGHDEARRSIRKETRLETRDNGLDFVLRVVPGHARFPAQAIVEDEIGGSAPAILRVKSVVPAAGVEQLAAGLGETVGGADKEIGKVDPGFRTAKRVLPVLGSRYSCPPRRLIR